LAYVYDVLNRVTEIKENGATSGPGLLASYQYDSLGRRSSVARAGGSGAATAYGYDGASRLCTLAQTLAGSASVTYTLGYNAANQIVTRQVSNSAYVANPGAITAGYTANGLNQYTSVTGITASYVAANQATLTYDPAGALQTETTAGATTTLLYDGANLVGEYSSSGTILDRYVQGPGVDEPVLWRQGSGTSTRSWLTDDNQGSIIGYADQSDNSGATYTYGPYGEPITSSGASAWGGSRYRFTGQIEIPEAQLYFYKARMYDPAMGRFYQTDPVGYASDVNLYAYATNDTLNWSDPSSLDDSNNDNDPTLLSGIIVVDFGGVGALIAGYANTAPSHTGSNGLTTVIDLFLNLHNGSSASKNGNSGAQLALLVAPQSNGCSLVSPTGNFIARGADARFNPQTAAMLSQALGNLNQQGIVLVITSGYRSSLLQAALRSNPGLGALTPAAVSWHSAGAAVDFGPRANAGNLGAIQAAMVQAGFVWGGSFRTPDARHYQSQAAGTSPSSAMVQACARAGG
jgi:RHS repeat-associated protein